MAAPYAGFLLVFSLYPIVFAFSLVFMNWDLVTAPELAGLDNARMLFADARFWRAIANIFVFIYTTHNLVTININSI